MSLSRVFDAARPPLTAPAGCAGVLGYVGKPGFTPHVWTPDEWRRFSHLRQFPAYVPDLAADPLAEAKIAVAAVEALGWARMPGAQTRVIVLDTETHIVPAFVQKFAYGTAVNDYVTVNYGSLSCVAQNLASFLWAADWDEWPHLEAGQTVHGHQYSSDPAVDLSVIDEWMLERGGVGPRHG